jgi:hypothetical protein
MGKYFRWEKHSRNEIALNPLSTILDFSPRKLQRQYKDIIIQQD